MCAERRAAWPGRGSHGDPASDAYERWWRDENGVLQVRIGPAWVFALWDAYDDAPVRCLGTRARGVRCRQPVLQRLDPFTIRISRYCDQHRPADEPAYQITAGFSDHPCPCGCGFRVLAYVMQAARLPAAPHRHPWLALLRPSWLP
ncbi:MAG: hypothetical protein C4289_14470 [Chloroflexota bacterium]